MNDSLRGAAPLHHTLLLSRPYTGVTVQTLHPTRFDHGLLLAQTPTPGFPVSSHRSKSPTTVLELAKTLGKEGARLLTDVLTSRAFVEPLKLVNPLSDEDMELVTGGKGVSKARKLKKEEARVNWKEDGVDDVLKRMLVFGRVWDENVHAKFSLRLGSDPVRVLYHRVKELDPDEKERLHALWSEKGMKLPPVGRPFLFHLNDADKTRVLKSRKRVGIRLKDDGIVEILSCSAAGRSYRKISDDEEYGIGLLVGWIENAERNQRQK
jgi:methionyl-tRNA formyltransferase